MTETTTEKLNRLRKERKEIVDRLHSDLDRLKESLIEISALRELINPKNPN